MSQNDELLRALALGWRPSLTIGCAAYRIIHEMPDTDECVVIGNHDSKGYYRVSFLSYFSLPAHRLSAAVHLGDPNGFHSVDHACFNRGCCNPRHLRYAKTALDNIRRGSGLSVHEQRKQKDKVMNSVRKFLEEHNDRKSIS